MFLDKVITNLPNLCGSVRKLWNDAIRDQDLQAAEKLSRDLPDIVDRTYWYRLKDPVMAPPICILFDCNRLQDVGDIVHCDVWRQFPEEHNARKFSCSGNSRFRFKLPGLRSSFRVEWIGNMNHSDGIRDLWILRGEYE